MKVLITGASGFLGQHFLFSLLQKKPITSTDEIYAIYSSAQGYEEAVRQQQQQEEEEEESAPHPHPNLHFHSLDLTSEKDVDAFFQKVQHHAEEEEEKKPFFDVCFHIAALSSPRACHASPETAKRINTPIHFLDHLKDTIIIALSTDQVYDGTSSRLYRESLDEPGPVNVYAQTKLDLEHYLLGSGSGSGSAAAAAADDDDDQETETRKRTQPAICLRSSIILGPLAPFAAKVKAHDTFLHFCHSRQGQETTFYTDEIRSVINVHDVNHILYHFYNCVKQGTMGGGVDDDDGDGDSSSSSSMVYNMGGSNPVSRMEMAAAVAEHCNFDNYETYFIAAKKADMTPVEGSVLSPLDISMDSSKLEELVGLKFQGLASTVQQTFAE